MQYKEGTLVLIEFTVWDGNQKTFNPRECKAPPPASLRPLMECPNEEYNDKTMRSVL